MACSSPSARDAAWRASLAGTAVMPSLVPVAQSSAGRSPLTKTACRPKLVVMALRRSGCAPSVEMRLSNTPMQRTMLSAVGRARAYEANLPSARPTRRCGMGAGAEASPVKACRRSERGSAGCASSKAVGVTSSSFGKARRRTVLLPHSATAASSARAAALMSSALGSLGSCRRAVTLHPAAPCSRYSTCAPRHAASAWPSALNAASVMLSGGKSASAGVHRLSALPRASSVVRPLSLACAVSPS